MSDAKEHWRRSTRLRSWDYSWAWWYYVTICTKDRACVLGEIADVKVVLSDAGKIVDETWQWLSDQYPYVELDEYVIMPNHFHGVLIINEDTRRGGSRTAPTEEPHTKRLGRLVGAFKTVSTKNINIMQSSPGVVFWQRNYYDHIIRNEADLTHIRTYIHPVRYSG